MMGNSRASESGTGKCTALTLFYLSKADRGEHIGSLNCFMRIVLLFLISLFTLCHVSGQSYEPKWVGQVVVLDTQNDSIVKQAEKANVKVKTKQSAGRLLAGIGNVRQKVYIQGGASTLQLNPNEPITLIVKCKDNDSDPYSFIQVIKFEKGRNERRTELAMQNWLGDTSEGNMELVQYEADSYGKSSYILTIQPQEGEFGVRVVNPNVQDERVPIFYCFGTSSYVNPVSVKMEDTKAEAKDGTNTSDSNIVPVRMDATKTEVKDGTNSTDGNLVSVKMEATKTDVRDGTDYEYKGSIYQVYVDKFGKRYINISKKDRVYLPDNK